MDALQDTLSRLEKADDVLLRLTEDKAALTAQLHDAQAAAAAARGAAEEAGRRAAAAEAAAAELRSQLEMAHNQQDVAHAAVEGAADQLQALTDSHEGLERQLAAASADLAAAQASAAARAQAVAQLEARCAALEGELQQTLQQHHSVLTQLQQAQRQLVATSAELEAAQADAAAAQQQAAEAQHQLEAQAADAQQPLEAQAADAQQQLEAQAANAQQQLEAAAAAAAQQLEAAEGERRGLVAQLEELRQENGSLQANVAVRGGVGGVRLPCRGWPAGWRRCRALPWDAHARFGPVHSRPLRAMPHPAPALSAGAAGRVRRGAQAGQQRGRHEPGPGGRHVRHERCVAQPAAARPRLAARAGVPVLAAASVGATRHAARACPIVPPGLMHRPRTRQPFVSISLPPPSPLTRAGLVDAVQALQGRNRLLQGDLDTLKAKYTGGCGAGGASIG